MQVHSSNVSSNRIEIQEILLILQLETDYFFQVIHFRKCSIRSSGITVFTGTSRTAILHEEVLQDSSAPAPIPAPTTTPILQGYPSTIHPHTPTCAHPENSPSRNPILHAEDKELFEYYYYITDSRNSTHRRQGDLLEMHPCVLQDLPVTFQASSRKSLQRQLQLLQLLQRHSSLSRHSSLFRHSSLSRHSRDIPDIPVIHDLPAFPGNSSNSTLFQYLQGFHPIPAFSD